MPDTNHPDNETDAELDQFERELAAKGWVPTLMHEPTTGLPFTRWQKSKTPEPEDVPDNAGGDY